VTKFRNKKHSSVSVNFHTGLAKVYIDVKLKYRNRKIRICHDKRTVK